jgi:hypothetical protein
MIYKAAPADPPAAPIAVGRRSGADCVPKYRASVSVEVGRFQVIKWSIEAAHRCGGDRIAATQVVTHEITERISQVSSVHPEIDPRRAVGIGRPARVDRRGNA